MSSALTRATCCLLALGLCVAGAGCAGTSQGGTVTVLVPWDQKLDPIEYNAFRTVVETFKQKNPGVQVTIESSREPTQQLDADLKLNDPPDLVDLPSPGAVYKYQQEGKLEPLSIPLRSYDQPWADLAELGTGTVYAVPVKADVKGLLWYYGSAPGSSSSLNWGQLESLSRQAHRAVVPRAGFRLDVRVARCRLGGADHAVQVPGRYVRELARWRTVVDLPGGAVRLEYLGHAHGLRHRDQRRHDSGR